MRKEELLGLIAETVGLDRQEEWDNSGVQIDMGGSEISKVLVALEVSDAVIDEAMDAEADAVITHHPLIFGSISSIKHTDVTGGYIQRLIRAGISCYSYHTPFDKMDGGNNDQLAEIMGLRDVTKFEDDAAGYLRKGRLPEKMYFGDLIKKLSEDLKVDVRLFRAVGDPEKEIETVGLCTGSGAEFIRDAWRERCDCYVTGDVKYHDAQLAKALGIAVLDAGHYATEKGFVENMAKLLRDKTDLEVICSEADLNPFSW